MQRHAIVIGVDRTGDLPTLTAAARGATEFRDWCASQTIDATLLVDDSEKEVDINQVRAAVKAVDPRVYSQLIIYFAGHGILKSPDEEYWLLSGSPQDQYDAVNVLQSIAYARNCGFRHIVFVSDACRAMPMSPRLMGVKGMSVFENSGPPTVRPKVDQLYATAPSDPAYEARLEDALTARGVFTQELLEALRGNVESVTEEYESGLYVTARRLDPYLTAQVPISVGRINPRFRQVPEVRSEADLPFYLAEFPGMSVRHAGSPPEVSLIPVPADFRAAVEAVALQAMPGSRVREAADELRRASGRQGFESGAGLSVVGTTVVQALARGGLCDVFQEDGAWQVRVRPLDNRAPRLDEPVSVMIEFADGTGTVLAVWPGYVGVMSVRDGRVVNVSYNPARHTPAYDEFVSLESEIAERRSLVAAAARHGRFRVRAGDAGTLARHLRQLKRIDPTLGLYAAYAYAQAGDVDEVRAIARYMHEDLPAVPFDVLLLTGELSADRLHVPFCPMLTQGWARLDGRQARAQLEEPVISAWDHLVPSLWTTFNPTGVRFVRTMFEAVDAGRPVLA